MNASPIIEDCVRLACLLECTARKPGNVHPAASFADLCYDDLVRSAAVVAPILAEAGSVGVGQTVLNAVTATHQAVGTNTNLGIVLLLAPLAAVPRETPLQEGIQEVLSSLSTHDAILVYEAIRSANPGGIDRVEHGDVANAPAGTLLQMMQIAAERDSVARQYASGFLDVLKTGVGIVRDRQDWFPYRWEHAVIGLHLELMASLPDTLIARKLGAELADESSRRAEAVLDAGWPESDRGTRRIQEFDGWLRADGNKRNPGTTADLVTATLFAVLRENVIAAPRDLVEPRPAGERSSLSRG